ncbi:cytochrome P450 71A4-like [Quercus suber]|uniref:cytochrome P450 71A4-like n=1 Tax=Quercus suber TaxID=58331 RepID=UPI0032DE7265
MDLLVVALGRGGGILRNKHGKWIKGFARNCGKVNSVMAELWALWDGLHTAAMENIHNLIVELDALAVVQLMKNSIANLSLEPLLTDCRLLLRKFPNLQVAQAYREANQCADALACIGSNSDVPFILFTHPPPMDVFAAITDTTYTVLNWAMTELLRHPEMMKNVQNEVREIIGNKKDITKYDLDKMHYLKAIIKETLRFHPPIPLLVPRKSIQDAKYMAMILQLTQKLSSMHELLVLIVQKLHRF